MNKNIPVIYYHSIAPAKNPGWFKNFLTLELKYFEEHLKYFVKNGYKFVHLSEVFYASKDPYMHRDKKVCLTFDDGYLDNFIYVYPLLKKYNAKGTIFINPDFVDNRSSVHKTLEDYWNKKATLEEINQWGFLNWDEMRLMEMSGLIDIQSHTMSHTKYFVSDELVGFHYPGADCLYYIGNDFPEKLPYYIGDKEFEKLLPYGYPVFEQKSSIIARKVTINKSFIHTIMHSFKDFHWEKAYNFEALYKIVRPIYDEAKRTNSIIESSETEEEYKERVHFELNESKNIIEKQLGKSVNFCCWPHGDNSELTHKIALDVGYKATTLGKMEKKQLDKTRFERFGLGNTKNSILLTRLKTNYKMRSFYNEQPAQSIKMIYEFFRDLGRN